MKTIDSIDELQVLKYGKLLMVKAYGHTDKDIYDIPQIFNQDKSLEFSKIINESRSGNDISAVRIYHQSPCVDIGLIQAPSNALYIGFSSINKQELNRIFFDFISKLEYTIAEFPIIEETGLRLKIPLTSGIISNEIYTFELSKTIAFKYSENLEKIFTMKKYVRFLISNGVSEKDAESQASQRFNLTFKLQ